MKKAGVMLIIKDGLILGISRRTNKELFGLPGGKFSPDDPDNDKTTWDTAVRETREETTVVVKAGHEVYHRVELGDGPNGVDFHSYSYYATDWEGEPTSSEEGEVRWLTVEELTVTKAAFGAFNEKMLDIFRQQYPNIILK